ncbi:hypothetical protein B296_00010920 [Ensete ventricosum]|uniref:Uncharacterized protein n=1 Tax=Ensete ventricosum TaxID=4639 RepID=A0A426XWZ7_ENSVE|nr:hypothetical protein B296_00010920 [Ensete ventricosum]
MDSTYPCMRVDFPQWEDGDPTRWISRSERYFRYHRTLEASIVSIAAIHLEEKLLNSMIDISIPTESQHGETLSPIYRQPVTSAKEVIERRTS